MDERHGDATGARRSAAPNTPGATTRARRRSGAPAPSLPDVATSQDESTRRGAATDAHMTSDTTFAVSGAPVELFDPRDRQTMERLHRRTAGGGYEIADTELVRAIRAWDSRGARPVAMELSQALVDRCEPEFRRRAAGLRHRPGLMEDAIAAMTEQLLKEALDPTEVFMTQNFIHYLKCLCIDNFNRTLRQEGLSYKRDEHGRPSGRPQHIPRALIEQIDLPAEDHDEPASASSVVADPRDHLSERLAAVEAQRILEYLPDSLDQRIFVLRVLEGRQWEEIAELCGKTERTMRLRYEKARILLQQCLNAEKADADSAGGEQNR